jgi:hypothetical protein
MSRSQAKDKAKLLEQLAKTPIVQVACERVGVPRATYYRWVKSDKKFAKACDEAIKQSSALINDMAESQLISAIKDKNMSAIIYWLKHKHPDYVTKLKLDANFKHESEELTPEQDELVTKALRLAGYIGGGENNEESNK